MPLEELLVRHALGLPGTDVERERDASGVMMIPVPQTGILESVGGEDAARAVPGVVETEITARHEGSRDGVAGGIELSGIYFCARGRAGGRGGGAARGAR